MKSILFNNACVITAYFLVFRLTFPSLKEISRVVTFFLSIVQFSSCWFAISLRQLNYYITTSRLCQVLFSSFFKKLFVVITPSFRGQCIYFTTLPLVCQEVFELFSKFFFVVHYLLSRPPVLYHQSYRSSSRPTALLLYHHYLPLSTKRIFGDFFLFCSICTYATLIMVYMELFPLIL